MNQHVTIQRSDFVSIEQRAMLATTGLTGDDKGALRRVAQTSVLVGNNFHTNPACPATQAVGRTRAGTCAPVTSFAFRCDELGKAHFGVNRRPAIFRVVDCDG